MKKHSKQQTTKEQLRSQIIGFGDNSPVKTYYPELQKKLSELNRFKNFLNEYDDAFVIIELQNGFIIDYNIKADKIFNCKKLIERKVNFKDFLKTLPDCSNVELLNSKNFKTFVKLENDEEFFLDGKIQIDENENPPLALVFFRDISREVVSNKETLEYGSHLEALLESLNDTAWSVDTELRILSINKVFAKMFERHFGVVLKRGMRVIDYLPEGLNTLWETRYNSTIENQKGDVYYDEFELDGDIQFTRSSFTPIIKNDNVIGVSVFARDITYEKKAEKALKESEARFRTMIEDAPIGTVISQNHIVRYVNRATLDLFKSKDQNELLSKPITDFIAPSSKKIGREMLEKWLSGELDFKKLEIKAVRLNGEEFDLLIYLSNIALPDGRATLYYLYDQTKQKNIERYLGQAKSSAEKSEKLKTEFLAQMSHEIRTPINTILSFASLLEDDISDKVSEEYAEIFGVMNNAGKRIIRTIDLILNMSEIQTGTYEALFKKFDIINDAIEPLILERKIDIVQKGLDLKVNLPKEEVIINADLYTVQQIFSNLLENAIKYTPTGIIEVKYQKLENDEHQIDISDTGIGISDEYLERLFKPFSQEYRGYTRLFEGNGLGLALVKEYCKLNNLNISVVSEKNRGSTFSINFAGC